MRSAVARQRLSGLRHDEVHGPESPSDRIGLGDTDLVERRVLPAEEEPGRVDRRAAVTDDDQHAVSPAEDRS